MIYPVIYYIGEDMKKLIRDFIVPDTGTIYVADEEEYREALYTKLLEEANELATDRNIEEAADVLEVLYAIGSLEGWSFSDISDVAIEKGRSRGTFDERHIWEH